ncbi:MAG: sodium:solute symporter family protein [Planctomycetota bacterium]|nr:sodium:solute symporter family protein [Planctomycetota bacterium]
MEQSLIIDPVTLKDAISGTNFSTVDWVIVSAYLMISVVIGLLVNRYAKSMAAYIGAGRSVGTWLGIATMTGTELGLVTVMYNAEVGYRDGFASFHIGLVFGVMVLIIGLTGFIVGPLRRQKVLTIPEYYGKRFNRTTRILGGVILATAGILNMGVFLSVGSKFLVGITGLNPDAMAVPIVMTILLVIVLIYTVLGGMISVIITDFVQFVVLSVGVIVTTLLAINELGMSTIVETVGREMEAGFNPVAANSNFGFSYVTFTVMMGLMTCAVWPTMVSRALAMESEKAVRRQYTWSSVSFAMRMVIPAFWGICAFVFIHEMASSNVFEMADAKDMADAKNVVGYFMPEGGGGTPDSAYAMPVFLGRILPVGLIGIITAAMIAAFMSTHDSYLLCWSSVLVQDVVAPIRGGAMSTQSRIQLTRLFIVLIGIFVWAWGLFYEGDDRIWDYLAVTGAMYFTGAAVVLAGGLYWKRSSSAGAIAGLLCGATAVLGVEAIRDRINHALGTEFTGPEFGLGSIAFSVISFVLFSLLIPDRTNGEGGVQ